MTPEQLKLSILQYAIEGNLVEHRSEEGNARQLYEQILEKKKEFIREGKIKRQKKFSKIVKKDLSFDIPDTWEWIKLGEIVSLITKGTTPKGGKSAYKKRGIGFLRAENVVGMDKIDKLNIKFIDNETHQVFLKRSIVEANDILITIAGTLGRTGLVNKNDLPLNINQAIAIIRVLDVSLIDLKYLIYALNSPEINKYLTKQKKVTAIPNLTLKIIENCILPLPPYKEQKRIVEKIEELLPLVDEYNFSWKKLKQLNVDFPEKMKKAILQYAIHGNLVEHRPEEGTAEELYKKIIEDRNQKIKEGIIKKDKRTYLDEIKETPFDIPDNWKWVTLGSILLKLTDGTHKTPKYTNHGVKFVSVKDMSSGKLSLEHTKFITEEEHKELFKRCNPQKGDILLSKVGTTGVPAIIDTDEQFSLFVSVALLKYNHKFINEKYLYYLLLSPLVQQQAAENTRGVGNKNWVLDAIGKTMIALPPYQEQIRIVSELEKILPYCEQLI